MSHATPPSNARADVSGRLLYADGSPAAGVPFELAVGGVARVGTTDASGAFTGAALVREADKAATLRSLDGFGVGLAADADELGSDTVAVPIASAGRLDDAYLTGAPKAMVLVTAPRDASAAARSAIAKLDIVGSHGEREVMTILSPRRIAELRGLGIEALVLDVDANAYAAETGSMSDDERVAHIDARIAAARAELGRLTASGAAPR